MGVARIVRSRAMGPLALSVFIAALVLVATMSNRAGLRKVSTLGTVSASASPASRLPTSARPVPNRTAFDAHDALDVASPTALSQAEAHNQYSLAADASPSFATNFLQSDFNTPGSLTAAAIDHAVSVSVDVGSFTNDLVGRTADPATGTLDSEPTFSGIPAFVVTCHDVPISVLQIGSVVGAAPVSPTTVDYHFVFDAISHQLLLSF